MQKRSSFESRITSLSVIASLPLLISLIMSMLYASISIYLIILCLFIGSTLIFVCNALIHQKSTYQFRSLSNLLDAMIKGDYTMRIRQQRNDSALNELVMSINQLAEHLCQQKLKSVESQQILNTVVDHIDVAIVSFDGCENMRLFNPAAKQLFDLSNDTNRALSIGRVKQFNTIRTGESQLVDIQFAQQKARYRIHIEEFHSSGNQHRLIFIADVESLLRQEEEKAWKNLVRVLSHEINNSLTPIASISQTLEKMSRTPDGLQNNRQDLQEGLLLISERSSALKHFVNSYQQLNKLPQPKKEKVDFSIIANKIKTLFGTANLSLKNTMPCVLHIDAIQIEQVLINLIKNAIDASKNLKEEICLAWMIEHHLCKISIIDSGTGIQNMDNLFVPFYTTKAKGSGIGLTLSRQIIEAHSGELTLSNREDGQRGCIAAIRLPVSSTLTR